MGTEQEARMRGINSPLLKCTDLALLISVAVTTNGVCKSSKVFAFKNLRKPFSMPFMDINPIFDMVNRAKFKTFL